jgi:hypothetical protein
MNRNENLREEFFFRQTYFKKTSIKDPNRGVRMDGIRPLPPPTPPKKKFGKLLDKNAINTKW